MLDSGVFQGQAFELIDGDIIDKMGQTPPHSSGGQLVMIRLIAIFGATRIRVQSSIEVAKSDAERSWPEPDVIVLAEAKPDYRTRHPNGDELLLLVEVADTTLRYDATTKRDLYARAGVPECWVLDVNGRQLIVHRNPIQGHYEHIATLSENDTVSLQSRPDASVSVAELLP